MGARSGTHAVRHPSSFRPSHFNLLLSRFAKPAGRASEVEKARFLGRRVGAVVVWMTAKLNPACGGSKTATAGPGGSHPPSNRGPRAPAQEDRVAGKLRLRDHLRPQTRRQAALLQHLVDDHTRHRLVRSSPGTKNCRNHVPALSRVWTRSN